ncbi:hypothetical protein [Azohydromonas caseinilytica]|uniref:Copper resistance protein D n=1 Tax=Azohydromonas caseinilytica TaxID=2728836 RepID=A0A848FBX0_9BURK|nr:hypothetical protein [Azohydromonas caseinilytica]NML15690.1 hypothetical protein [Azohydromonas caseinilytica]
MPDLSTLEPPAALAWITGHPWAYPALEAAHITGIALLVGSLVVFELRAWGLGRELAAPVLARLALRVSLAGFALVATSGLLMFGSQPGELFANRYFMAKLALLLAAGLNAVLFHVRGGVARLDGVARAQTALSLGLWLAVIICGRWIAYA